MESENRQIVDIPTEAEANEVISDFESEGCTATKIQQPNDKWTVNAICPVE